MCIAKLVIISRQKGSLPHLLVPSLRQLFYNIHVFVSYFKGLGTTQINCCIISKQLMVLLLRITWLTLQFALQNILIRTKIYQFSQRYGVCIFFLVFQACHQRPLDKCRQWKPSNSFLLNNASIASHIIVNEPQYTWYKWLYNCWLI